MHALLFAAVLSLTPCTVVDTGLSAFDPDQQEICYMQCRQSKPRYFCLWWCGFDD